MSLHRVRQLKPIHPGIILQKEFLRPLRLTEYRLAKDIGVPARRINEIIHGTRAISPDTALRFGRYFRLSPQFWLNLQMHYDLEMQRTQLTHIVPAYKKNSAVVLRAQQKHHVFA